MTPAERPCVLLVDDSEADNFFHRLVLEESGLVDRVAVARDGRAALALLGGESGPPLRPDLILVDLNMPRMSGWQFLDALGELDGGRDAVPRVVVLTTTEHPTERARADAHPLVAGFLTKPLTRALLLGVLDQAD